MKFEKGNPLPDPVCPYQGNGVLCGDFFNNPGKCQKCGWHPDVKVKRLQARFPNNYTGEETGNE